MKKIFKVNFEKYKDEDNFNVFFYFIERNKNKIKIIHNNHKISSLINEKITKISKIKFILLDNPFCFQSFHIKYKIRDKYKGNYIQIFGYEFVKNNYSKCFILYKDIIYPLEEYFSSKYIDIKKDNKLEINLLSFENITDFSYMFNESISLEDFSFDQNNENNIIKEDENNNIDII